MSNNALDVIEVGLRSLAPTFESVLVDKGIVFEREIEFAMQILSGNEYLMKVAMGAPQSIKDAITNVAAIGISLNPARKQAYLVPRKGRVCLDISYMGLIDMAVATGSIRWAQAALVYQNDKFTLNGYDRAPTHVFEPFSTERGDLVGVYSVAKTADGDYLTHTMSIADVYKIRDRSESFMSGNKSPWKTDEGEMVKKTNIKQASKYWPKTERLDKAIHYLNTDGGEGLETLAVDAAPANAKPAVAMPQAKAEKIDQSTGEITDVVAKVKPAAEPAATSVMPASDGEIAYITGKITKKGIGIAEARELAGLDAATTLKGLSKDGFIALRDALK